MGICFIRMSPLRIMRLHLRTCHYPIQSIAWWYRPLPHTPVESSQAYGYSVIALHLISAALIPSPTTSTPSRSGTLDSAVVPEQKTAVICYNVRGVGKSGGKQPWLGAGEGDYSAVERWGLDVTGVGEIWRFVSPRPRRQGTDHGTETGYSKLA